MIDFYKVADDAIIALLKTLSIFGNSWQVSQGDDNVLSRGADYFAITRPSTIGTPIRYDVATNTVEFGTELYIYTRYKNEKDTSVLFRAFRSDVFNLLISNPTLSDADYVLRSLFSANSEIGYLTINDMPNTPPALMLLKIDIITTILIPLTEGEYGN